MGLRRGLGRRVVETDADAVFAGPVGGDFVAEPAFEEDDRAGLRVDIDERLLVARGVGLFCGSRHHQAQSGVFEFEGAGAFGSGDIIGAADDAVRVDVAGVSAAGFENVDPEAVEFEFASGEVEVEGLGKGIDVRLQCQFEVFELRGARGEVVERGV